MSNAHPLPNANAVPVWSLGDRLAKARQHADISSANMANSLGVSRNTVSNWEHDRVPPPKHAVIAWAAVTGVPRWWIENGGDQPSADTVTAWYPRLAAA